MSGTLSSTDAIRGRVHTNSHDHTGTDSHPNTHVRNRLFAGVTVLTGADEMLDAFIWRNRLITSSRSLTAGVHTRCSEPRETVWREHLKVVTDGGLLCLIFRDLLNGGWFLARPCD